MPIRLAVRLRVLLPLLCGCWLAGLPTLRAQSGPRLGTRISPPFVLDVDTAAGTASGLAIDLWNEVVARVPALQGTPQWSTHEISELLQLTSERQLGVAVAALTVTREREQIVDFTLPFMKSGMGIAVRSGGEAGVGDVLMQVFSWRLLRALGALFLVLLVFGSLVWLAERRRNPEQFGGAKGVGEGLWWSAVTMTTVGYGDRAPVTWLGRSIALIWMFASIVIISSYTASIASALTVSNLQSAVRGREDLPHVRVVSVGDSSSGEWLRANGIAFRSVESVETAVAELAAGRADAAVYDRPMLRYLARQNHPGELDVLPDSLREDLYAFALPENDERREDINQALAEIVLSETWRELRLRYLGSD